MAEHNEIGKIGEEMAQKFVSDLGYKIQAVNWQFKKAEIDIICKDKEFIVFVEVKTRTSRYFENPKDAVTISKQKHIIRAAHAYIEENNIDMEARFDIISILIEPKNTEIEHIIDAFYPLV